ncbi:hypothetical protein B566_EDAN015741, partial [Ephemera danica]
SPAQAVSELWKLLSVQSPGCPSICAVQRGTVLASCDRHHRCGQDLALCNDSWNSSDSNEKAALERQSWRHTWLLTQATEHSLSVMLWRLETTINYSSRNHAIISLRSNFQLDSCICMWFLHVEGS